MEQVAVIDAGSGNLNSVLRAVQVSAERLGKPSRVQVTHDAEQVLQADRIILPGQGAFAACMHGLQSREGLIEALEAAVLRRGAPLLGICVGMQLLAETGLEHGEQRGLGWIGGVCRPLQTGPGRIPHMGWNTAVPCSAHPVLAPLGAGRAVYFAHSYIVADAPGDTVMAETEHNEKFACALARNTIAAVQFHPEKSQQAGLEILTQFLSWRP